MFTSLVTEPIFVVPNQPGAIYSTDGKLRTFSNIIEFERVKSVLHQSARGDTNAAQEAAERMEHVFRRMLACCASKVCVIDTGGFSPDVVRRALVPSVKKRVQVVDRRHRVWLSVAQYLVPIVDCSTIHHRRADGTWYEAHPHANRVAWHLYNLMVANQKGAEAIFSPDETMHSINILDSLTSMSREAKARLSVLRGLFELYVNAQQIPGFRIIPTQHPMSVGERLEEISEDSLFLEASALRRLLGLRENVTKMKKQLHRILRSIARNRSWAKGIVSAASQPVSGLTVGFKVAEKLFDIGLADSSETGPIVVTSKDQFVVAQDAVIRFERHLFGNAMFAEYVSERDCSGTERTDSQLDPSC